MCWTLSGFKPAPILYYRFGGTTATLNVRSPGSAIQAPSFRRNSQWIPAHCPTSGLIQGTTTSHFGFCVAMGFSCSTRSPWWIWRPEDFPRHVQAEVLLCCVALKLPQPGVGVQIRTPVQGSPSLKTRCEGFVCPNDWLPKKELFEPIELSCSRIWGVTRYFCMIGDMNSSLKCLWTVPRATLRGDGSEGGLQPPAAFGWKAYVEQVSDRTHTRM